MAKLLLSLHVLAGIVFVGPVTVAVSLFPRYARAGADPARRRSAMPVLVLLRRISTVYAVAGLSVPVLGLGVAVQLGVLTDAWLLTAIVLTLVAAGVLAGLVLPTQQSVMGVLESSDSPLAPGPDGEVDAAVLSTWRSTLGRLGATSGVFALLWAIVVVLMIVRPGSTTSV